MAERYGNRALNEEKVVELVAQELKNNEVAEVMGTGPSRRYETNRVGAAGKGVHRKISKLPRDLPDFVDSSARGATANGRQPQEAKLKPH